MSVSLRKQRDKPSENRIFKKDKKMVTIYNTTLSATSQRHFSDGLGGVYCAFARETHGNLY